MPSITIALLLIRRVMSTRRDIFMSLLLPAVVLAGIVALFASTSDTEPKITILNQDKGSYGAMIGKQLEQEPKYEITTVNSGSDEQLKQSLEDGDINAAIIIPADYSDQLLEGKSPSIVFYRMNEQLWNASLALTLEAVTEKMSHAAALLAQSNQLDRASLDQLLATIQENRITTQNADMQIGETIANPEVIGLMLLFVLLLVMRSISFIMEDREQRTMARMFTAPVRGYQIALGNFLGSAAVGTLQLIVMVGLCCYLFGYDPGFSPVMLLLLLECFLITSVGLASAVAGLVRNSMQLSNIGNLVITPTCMLGGCFWPISIMPDFMQKLANFTPQKWLLEAADRLSGGGGISTIAVPVFIILLFAVVLLAFGAVVLRPSRQAVSG
ncbi:ABC-2 type transport system permease protein [Paenibacillus cellulosilyticus]|uniref:ABC-2 type transport system permease protein n=1 Tax=Paenibacillus cellulosilyticus TaxID=375489 RepID=A0A2V2YWF7_9BACL|nr:ABC transporter permease [Paenibacillus cellulosilyticus]PWW06148.1 ABC-2 type transport system permease protein [Paenibacillus cellulosilyticus]QKS43083.1 ABC transporter permease [Paenibacillus cellulosilyticus]